MFSWPAADTMQFENDTPPPCGPTDLPCLTLAQHRLFTEAWSADDGQDRSRCPWPLQLDARPLALLAQSALMGHRVYEFMRLRTSGDLLRYLWVQLHDDKGPVWPALQADAQKLSSLVKRRLDVHTRGQHARQPPLKGLAWAHFDALWLPGGLPASPWTSAGWMEDEAAAWLKFRSQPLWPARLQALMDTVRSLQGQLSCSHDPLIQHELAAMAAGTHWRDAQPWSEQVGGLSAPPDEAPRLPVAVRRVLLALAARPEVRSVSALTADRSTWRQLVLLQLQRAADLGCPPQEAFALTGPLDRVSGALLRDWGGEVEVPLEGCRLGAVSLLPGLGGFDESAALAQGSLFEGLEVHPDRGPCLYLLLRNPVPTGPQDQHRELDGWHLYWRQGTPAPDGC